MIMISSQVPKSVLLWHRKYKTPEPKQLERRPRSIVGYRNDAHQSNPKGLP